MVSVTSGTQGSVDGKSPRSALSVGRLRRFVRAREVSSSSHGESRGPRAALDGDVGCGRRRRRRRNRRAAHPAGSATAAARGAPSPDPTTVIPSLLHDRHRGVGAPVPKGLDLAVPSSLPFVKRLLGEDQRFDVEETFPQKRRRLISIT